MRIAATRSGEVILPFSSETVRHIWSVESSTRVCNEKRHRHNGASPAKGLASDYRNHLIVETFQHGEEYAQRDLIYLYRSLMAGSKKDRVTFFSVVLCERTRGSCLKQKYKKFYLNIRKKKKKKNVLPLVGWLVGLFCVVVKLLKHWNNFPEVVESPLLEIFKVPLVIVLNNVLQLTLF